MLIYQCLSLWLWKFQVTATVQIPKSGLFGVVNPKTIHKSLCLAWSYHPESFTQEVKLWLHCPAHLSHTPSTWAPHSKFSTGKHFFVKQSWKSWFLLDGRLPYWALIGSLSAVKNSLMDQDALPTLAIQLFCLFAPLDIQRWQQGLVSYINDDN